MRRLLSQCVQHNDFNDKPAAFRDFYDAEMLRVLGNDKSQTKIASICISVGFYKRSASEKRFAGLKKICKRQLSNWLEKAQLMSQFRSLSCVGFQLTARHKRFKLWNFSPAQVQPPLGGSVWRTFLWSLAGKTLSHYSNTDSKIDLEIESEKENFLFCFWWSLP